MTIRIKADGAVEIRVPYKTLQREIDDFFREKTPWVKKIMMEREKRLRGETAQPKRFISGETFLYLGEGYPLELCDMNGRRDALILSYGKFLFDEKRTGEAEEIFVNWYKKRTRELFVERVAHYSRQLSLFQEGIKITSAFSRYGSCSPKNHLSFTWRLMMAPLVVIDYIIIHELIHIKIKNHSKKFWDSVGAAMPDFRTHKRWLKENGHSLKL
jgi:hypothetical protein